MDIDDHQRYSNKNILYKQLKLKSHSNIKSKSFIDDHPKQEQEIPKNSHNIINKRESKNSPKSKHKNKSFNEGIPQHNPKNYNSESKEAKSMVNTYDDSCISSNLNAESKSISEATYPFEPNNQNIYGQNNKNYNDNSFKDKGNNVKNQLFSHMTDEFEKIYKRSQNECLYMMEGVFKKARNRDNEISNYYEKRLSECFNTIENLKTDLKETTEQNQRLKVKISNVVHNQKSKKKNDYVMIFQLKQVLKMLRRKNELQEKQVDKKRKQVIKKKVFNQLKLNYLKRTGRNENQSEFETQNTIKELTYLYSEIDYYRKYCERLNQEKCKIIDNFQHALVQGFEYLKDENIQLPANVKERKSFDNSKYTLEEQKMSFYIEEFSKNFHKDKFEITKGTEKSSDYEYDYEVNQKYKNLAHEKSPKIHQKSDSGNEEVRNYKKVCLETFDMNPNYNHEENNFKHNISSSPKILSNYSNNQTVSNEVNLNFEDTIPRNLKINEQHINLNPKEPKKMSNNSSRTMTNKDNPSYREVKITKSTSNLSKTPYKKQGSKGDIKDVTPTQIPNNIRPKRVKNSTMVDSGNDSKSISYINKNVRKKEISSHRDLPK